MTPARDASAPRRAAARAPAKVNFGLAIRGRRDDGYHEIESVFLPIDLADEVAIRIAPAREPSVRLRLEGEVVAIPADERNLAWRAAACFLAQAARDVSIEIRLRKRIPAGAGLGGGSSDAGAVLRLLAREIFPGTVSPSRLEGIALSLGADVPFFLNPIPARVGGIGERVEPCPAFPALDLVLVMAGAPLATAEVYRAYDAQFRALTPSGGELTIRALSELGRRGALLRCDLLESLLANDLEPVAQRLRPEIGAWKARLKRAGARAVGLSGSGPVVFGVFADRQEAAEAAQRLRRLGGAAVWLTRTWPGKGGSGG